MLPHGNQEEDDSVDEEGDIEEDFVDGDQVEGNDLEVGEELGYIESEKRRRKMKRVEEEKNMLDDNLEKEKVEKADVKYEVEKEDPEMDGLCEYEKIRMRNIRQREALFAELALQVFSSTCALHCINQ